MKAKRPSSSRRAAPSSPSVMSSATCGLSSMRSTRTMRGSSGSDCMTRALYHRIREVARRRRESGDAYRVHCRRAARADEADDERGPAAAVALDLDAPAVLGDDLLRQRQPEAGAALLGREEGIEDLRQIGGLDALAGVGDGE